jgi:hypothetical protein
MGCRSPSRTVVRVIETTRPVTVDLVLRPRNSLYATLGSGAVGASGSPAAAGSSKQSSSTRPSM